MNKKRFNRTISVILVTSIYSQTLWANQFMPMVDEWISLSHLLTRRVVENKFLQIQKVWIEYHDQTWDQARVVTDDLNKNLSELNQLGEQLNQIQNDPDIDGFKKIDSFLATSESIYFRSKLQVQELSALFSGAASILTKMDNFCAKYPSQLDIQAITAQPSNFRLPSSMAYTRYKSPFSSRGVPTDDEIKFSGDPLVQGHALFASGIIVATGVTAASYFGASISVAFVSGGGGAVTVSVANSTVAYAALGGMLIGVAAVIIISEAWSQYRNAERKQKSENEIKKQEKVYAEALAKYAEFKLSNEKLRSMAQEVCISSQFQSVLNENLEKLRIFSKLGQEQILKLVETSSRLDSVMEAFYRAKSDYKDRLAGKYEADLINKAESENNEIAKTGLLWDVFNKDIKLAIMKLRQELRNSQKTCSQKLLEVDDMDKKMMATLDLLEDSSHDEKFSSELAEVKSRAQKALDLVRKSNLLIQCHQTEPDFGGPYEF